MIFKTQFIHWFLPALLLITFFFGTKYGSLLFFSFNLRNILSNVLSVINGFFYLLSHLILIDKLNIDPDIPVVSGLTAPVALELIFIGALLVFSLLNLQKKPLPAFGILWFFLHAIAVYAAVPRTDIINERHFYPGLPGIFIVAYSYVFDFFNTHFQSRRYLRIPVFCLLLILSFGTVSRNVVYKNEVTLWEDTVSKSPNKARVYNNLGYAYFLEGNYEKAKNAYSTALKLDPLFIRAKNNLDLLMNKQKSSFQ